MRDAPSHVEPVLIFNPAANRGNMQAYRTLIEQRLAHEQATYVETEQQGQARTLAEQAAREGRPVIVVGGDGSINEVINGILSSGQRVPLGIVAAGSGNDFAWHTLKLPRDPVQALDCAFSGQLREIDAGCVNGQYFANGFGVGLDANIAVATTQLKKLPLMSGARLYYTAALKELVFGFHRCPWFTFSFDDIHTQETEKRYIFIAVTNGPAYGAGFYINPTADATDGLLDVCVVDYAPLPRVLSIFPGVKQGKHVNEPEASFYRVKQLTIASKQPTNIQVDGETGCASHFEAHVLPAALLIRT